MLDLTPLSPARRLHLGRGAAGSLVGPPPPPGFILGTHEVTWLAEPRCAGVPLMVSDRRLRDRKTLPRALGLWVLDSGGFTELQMFGRWTVPIDAYIARVRRYICEIGNLAWAACQDWMCEPIVRSGGRVKKVVFAGTHLSTAEHIRRTVENYLELCARAPEVPWLPTLQGWRGGEYLDCLELYDKAGVDLRSFPVVGVGTMCRRQDTFRAGHILRDLAMEDLLIHAFGFKLDGLREHGCAIFSADSLAWSEHAKHQPPLDGHDRPGPGRPLGHKHCNNCLDFALEWYGRAVLAFLEGQRDPGAALLATVRQELRAGRATPQDLVIA